MASEVADLPEPDSPTRPRVSPGLIWKEIPSTARLVVEGDGEVVDFQERLGHEEW